VLVDNGSRDETPGLLAEFARRAPMPVTVVQEPRAGLARARNAGVRAARAPLLAFTDDDCYPEADYLARWQDVFADPAVAFGAGRIVLHDPDDYPITIRTETEPTPLPPGTFVTPGLVQGANVAYRRPVLEAVGGFDPALGPGGLFNFEDLDMAVRVMAAGFAGGYFPGPTVRHHHRRRAGPAVDALKRSYDGGRGAYYASLLLRPGLRAPVLRHCLRSWRWLAADAIGRELSAGRALSGLSRPARRRPRRTPACGPAGSPRRGGGRCDVSDG
jgi:GT2 family glycosyltransferase